ncbi:hypothetical protein KDA11_03300 [Candidatus Saccharibacteria bacterium]|nr:hypothetical protein [Candidatus Saccharibacteria bacterium]
MSTYENLIQLFDRLPPELIDSILAYLEPAELLVLRQRSTGYLRETVQSHMDARKIEARISEIFDDVVFALYCESKECPIFPKGYEVPKALSFLHDMHRIHIWRKGGRGVCRPIILTWGKVRWIRHARFNWDTAGVAWLCQVLTNLFRGIPSEPASVSFADLEQVPYFPIMNMTYGEQPSRRHIITQALQSPERKCSLKSLEKKAKKAKRKAQKAHWRGR